jgi:hypothetical protein
MSPTAMIIAGVLQICLAPALIIGRRPIADWLSDNVPPLDVAWFHVRGELLMAFGGIAGAISGGMFLGLGAVALTYA